MAMNYQQAHEAMDDARRTFNSLDDAADKMADMLRGRLRKVRSGYTLKMLKNELRNFNTVTGKWKP